MNYGEKRRLRLVPYVYGKLAGVPAHERASTSLKPKPWLGRFHRFVEDSPRWRIGDANR